VDPETFISARERSRGLSSPKKQGDAPALFLTADSPRRGNSRLIEMQPETCIAVPSGGGGKLKNPPACENVAGATRPRISLRAGGCANLP